MLDNYRILCYNITMVDSTTRSYLGDLAQLVEHLLCKQEVKSSILLVSIGGCP